VLLAVSSDLKRITGVGSHARVLIRGYLAQRVRRPGRIVEADRVVSQHRVVIDVGVVQRQRDVGHEGDGCSVAVHATAFAALDRLGGAVRADRCAEQQALGAAELALFRHLDLVDQLAYRARRTAERAAIDSEWLSNTARQLATRRRSRADQQRIADLLDRLLTGDQDTHAYSLARLGRGARFVTDHLGAHPEHARIR
jgi:hypothetical protein